MGVVGRGQRHPLEEKLNADADDIMNAILGGFRAIIDVKGKLSTGQEEQRRSRH